MSLSTDHSLQDFYCGEIGLLKDGAMPDGITFKENKELEYSSVQKAISILLAFIPDNKPMGNLQLSNQPRP